MAVMMNERQATWTSIGTDVDMSTTVDEVLERAGLNYEVEKKDIFLDNGLMIPGKKATVNTTTGKIYGVVSDKYKVCNNKEAFQFIANINDKLSFVKAGETQTGMVYVIAKLDDVDVLGDTFTPYVIFQNGHNGNYTLRTTICPLRIICTNQFTMSFKESPNTINIRHSNNLFVQMQEAESLLRDTATYMKNFEANAELLATMKITNEKDLINHFFEETTRATLANKNDELTERQLRAINDKTEMLYNIYRNTPDNSNFQGTVWGLINGFTDFNTHLIPQRTTDTANENRFVTVTMDPRIIMQFIKFATEYAR